MKVLDAENRWRAAGLFYTMIFCTAVLTGFSAQNLLEGETLAGAVALSGLPFVLATLVRARRPGAMPPWAPWPALGFLAAILLYSLHVSDVFDGATLMWLCAVPPTAILTLRARPGLAVSAALFLVLLSGLGFADHELPASYSVRLVAAYLFVTGLMFAFERNRELVMAELEEAERRIGTLEGLLRICGWCHGRMRDDRGAWISTERFFQDRAPVSFSHGVCPECQAGLERSLAAAAAE